MSYRIPLKERETIINYGYTDKSCEIWTSDTTVMTKLDKLCNNSDHYSLKKQDKVDGSVVAKEYLLDDKSLISFRSKKSDRKMEMSDEQKAEVAIRLHAAKQNKK